MKVKQKLITLLLLQTFLLRGCNNVSSEKTSKTSSEPNTFTVDKSLVFGMTDLSYQENGTNYLYTHKLFKNMGVKSVRIWMHCNWIMNSPTDYSESGLAKMSAIYNDIKDEGYQIIAMNHSNFHASGMINSSATTAKPARDLKEGSYYMSWLEDLETTYYNMVLKFPEIEYWEIDNECNNDDFMPRLGGGFFSLEEKAEIYYDMMYFASRGIHRANPQAKTVMGGLVVRNIETFLNYIYDLIAAEDSWSTNPDDYFEVACWHPYMSFFTRQKFIDLNNQIYDVIKMREGKDKKVFITEIGFSEGGGNSISDQKRYIKEMYEAARDDLYFIESMHYFRMYDNYASTWGSDSEKYFGLFYDPVVDKVVDGVKVRDLAEPKDTAYVYQEVAGGSGSLTIYQDFLKGDVPTKLIMNRGYSAHAKENTVTAFELAGAQSGVYAIHTDVRLTSDKKTILMHDDNLQRVTLGKSTLNVNNSTFAEVRAVKLPDIQGNTDVHTIPNVAEYLTVVKNTNKVAVLEIKKDYSAGDIDIIMQDIVSNIDLSKVIIASKFKNVLTYLRSKYSDLSLQLLLNNYAESDVSELQAKNYSVAFNNGGITNAEILTLLSQKIDINIRIVDDLVQARKLGQQGITYLTTNSIVSFKD